MDTSPHHSPRIGTYFNLIGSLLLILFLGSGFSGKPAFSFFFLSLVAFFIGYLFRRRAPRASNERFSAVRKAIERSRQRRDEKKK
jgi:hypothetical protein